MFTLYPTDIDYA